MAMIIFIFHLQKPPGVTLNRIILLRSLQCGGRLNYHVRVMGPPIKQKSVQGTLR